MKLLGWLMRKPRPVRLRCKGPDDEWREVPCDGKRTRWGDVEKTILASETVTVECISVKGAVLRSIKLDELEASDDDDVPETFEAEGDASKSLGKAMREQAAMLDAYGRRLNESFARGADAASKSSDKLVELVEVLTNHLAVAITNVNNLSANLSSALQQVGSPPDDESQSTKMLQGVMAMITAGAGARAAPPPDPNGKPKKP